MIVLGIEPSWLALSLSCCTLVVAPLLPPSTSSKCLPPPSRLTGDMSDRIPAKKEPCLTPTLMDEGQARNPNTAYNGYKMEFWKFALTWKLICPVQHTITQKEQKQTTKKGGISLTIMGQRQTFNSIHKPQR